MTVTYQQLASYLNPNALKEAGGDLVLDFNILTGNPQNLSSTCVNGVQMLLQALASLTAKINADRAKANPPLDPLDLCSQGLSTDVGGVTITYTVTFQTNYVQLAAIVVDPQDYVPPVAPGTPTITSPSGNGIQTTIPTPSGQPLTTGTSK